MNIELLVDNYAENTKQSVYEKTQEAKRRFIKTKPKQNSKVDWRNNDKPLSKDEIEAILRKMGIV